MGLVWASRVSSSASFSASDTLRKSSQQRWLMRWASPSTPECWRMTFWMDLMVGVRLEISGRLREVFMSVLVRWRSSNGHKQLLIT